MHRLVSRFEERNNDMYFMEICGDRIVVNHHYSGIKILNRLLEPVDELNLFDGVMIYHAYSDGDKKRMVLYCAENDCLVPVDLAEMKSNVISLEGAMRQTVFSPVHRWQEKELLLLDYSGNPYRVDLSEGHVRFCTEKAGMFGNTASLIRQHRLIHFEDGMLVLETPSGENIRVFDLKGRLITEVGKPEGNWHSAVYHDGGLIFASETRIVGVRNHATRFVLEPEPSEYFLKVKVTGDRHLWVLSSDPSNPEKSRISQYRV